MSTESKEDQPIITRKSSSFTSRAESLFYQIWSPNNKFLLKGRLMIGEGWKIPIGTFLLINVSFILLLIIFILKVPPPLSLSYLSFRTLLNGPGFSH
jgi:hypothetical protein